MTRRHVHILAAVVLGLIALLFVLETANDSGDDAAGGRLLPGLEAAANELTEITVDGPEDDDTVTLRNDDGRWVVADRDGYPADLGKLRQLVLALAEAGVAERKTADPANYARLGVADPGEEGAGTRVVLGGGAASFAVILGDSARGDARYARIDGEAGSVLIDRNPEAPAAATDWLLADIADIDSGEIRKVTISHDDGETIVIEKIVDKVEDEASAESVDDEAEVATDEATVETPAPRPVDFTVLDIPEGRELSYDTVANGIGAALANLTLDDVRRAADGEPAATAVFETFDDAIITATVRSDADGAWVSFAAEPDVDGLNERTAGWEYRLPEFKKNLLIRRWEDLLKAEEM